MQSIKLSLGILVLISIVTISVASSSGDHDLEEWKDVQTAWAEFKQKFHRHYSSEQEEQKRFKIFEDNYNFIQNHNENQFKTGKSTFALGINQFADLTNKEYQQKLSNLPDSLVKPGIKSSEIYTDNDVSALPDEVNWVKKGVVAPIKDQGDCAASYAFAASSAIESAHAIKKGNLVQLSEQELVDCSHELFNQGCYGGFVNRAYQFVLFANGLDTEKSYPYEGVKGSCRSANGTIGASITGFVYVKFNDENAVKSAVANIGPVSAHVDAHDRLFQFYAKGIYNNPNCTNYKLNLYVVVEGYGVQDGQEYWLVRNSLGTTWGMDGYAMMIKQNNQCGIATEPTYPVI